MAASFDSVNHGVASFVSFAYPPTQDASVCVSFWYISPDESLFDVFLVINGRVFPVWSKPEAASVWTPATFTVQTEYTYKVKISAGVKKNFQQFY